MKMKHAMAAASGAILVITAGLSATALADEEAFSVPWGSNSKPGVAPVTDESYRQECGSCHMAYPPGLLPPHSWERLMTTLGDHFGENVKIPKAHWKTIINYLLNGAAGRVDYQVSNQMVRNIKGIPVRISELPYFRHRHQDIPEQLVSGNPEIRSFSNCTACHAQAEKGRFDEERNVSD
ncbi:cytochrome C [Thiolapillus sp.]